MADPNASYAVSADALMSPPTDPAAPVEKPIALNQSCKRDANSCFQLCDIDGMMIVLDQSSPDPWFTIKSRYQNAHHLEVEPNRKSMQIEFAPLNGDPDPPKLVGRVGLRSATLQVVAPAQSGKIGAKRDGKTTKIDALVAVAVGPCGPAAHPHLWVEPSPPGFKGKMPMKRTESVSFPIYSEPMFSEGSFQLAAPFSFLARMWGSAPMARTYAVRVNTCGIRNQPDTVQAVGVTIEVYPEAMVSLELKLPPFHESSWSRERVNATQNRGDWTIKSQATTTSRSSTDRTAVTETTSSSTDRTVTVTRPDGTSSKTSVRTDKASDQQGDRKYTSRDRGKDGADPKMTGAGLDDGDNLVWPGFEINVEYNNAAIGGSWEQWSKAIKTLRTGLQDVQKLQNLLNTRFQFGWKVSGSIKGLEGSLKIAYGIKSLPGQFKVGRYLVVDLSILLVEASVEASFGLTLAFGDLKGKLSTSDWAQLIDARVSLTLTGGITVKGSFERLTGLPAVGRTVTLTGEITLTAKVIVQVAAIISLVGTISGGVEATGTFAATLEEAPVFTLGADRKPVVAAVQVKTFKIKVYSVSREVINRAPLMEPIDFVNPKPATAAP